MHVVFISNSTGRATARVRRILDAYAARIGDSAWATPITEEALKEVQTALKRGISRHTSVACYRNKGFGSMVLKWVVGNKHHYDQYGRFAPETQARTKGFPMPYRHAALLAMVGGLGHDVGKSTRQFQHKIGNGAKLLDPSDGIRHEWISAWICSQFIQDRAASLPAIMQKWASALTDVVNSGWMPVEGPIDSARKAVVALIATHHQGLGHGDIRSIKELRLIATEKIATSDAHTLSLDKLGMDRRERLGKIEVALNDAMWIAFGDDLLRGLKRLDGVHEGDPEYWHGVIFMARAALLLADHEVSSADRTRQPGKARPRLYANTFTAKSGERVLNQDLLWHLKNVGEAAQRNVGIFANPDLPALPVEVAQRVARRSEDPRYQWQDLACNAIQQSGAMKRPALIFNVASTGAGKTRGNVKLLCALRACDNVRISSAFNLRTLTLQTHDAYCEELEFAKNFDCACLVGDPVVREIHESLRDDGDNRDEAALETEYDIEGADSLSIPNWLDREADRVSGKSPARARALKKMLASPVLVSTIDFLNAAGDMTQPNADHAHALLRLAHSDLILDELDSYDTDSMVAVLRLIHIAAMFARNVVISSATLSPALAEYALRAYRAGLRIHSAMFGIGENAPASVILVSDAAETQVRSIAEAEFGDTYQGYLAKMAHAEQAPTKIFRIADVGTTHHSFHAAIVSSAAALHDHHGWKLDGIRVSVGLVRVANIDTCFDVASALLQGDERTHVVTYHAREPLLRRAWKERQFDLILKRKSGSAALMECMRGHLAHFGVDRPQDAMFIVVATPVEEVGRDHDFDWAIIEPSSMHSIIQTAGRVNRHRRASITSANIAILNRCYRDIRQESVKAKPGCVFVMPGNEIPIESAAGRVTTSHPAHETTHLLGIALGADAAMDIRLMFGENRCRFARFDEESIRTRLDRVIGQYIEQSGSLVWFSKWFGDAYPLREQSNTKIKAVLPFGSRDIKFFSYDYQQEKARRIWKWTDVMRSKDCDIPERAWICPTINEVAATMSKLLQRELGPQDMSFQIYREQCIAGADWRGIALQKN